MGVEHHLAVKVDKKIVRGEVCAEEDCAEEMMSVPAGTELSVSLLWQCVEFAGLGKGTGGYILIADLCGHRHVSPRWRVFGGGIHVACVHG